MTHDPKSEPVLRQQGGDGSPVWSYDDGSVLATLNTEMGAWCTIEEFSVRNPGMGHGAQAVAWLKQRFRFLSVDDPGSEVASPDAFAFWRRMAEKGLIDQMCDDLGTVIFADGEWVLDNIDPELFPNLVGELEGPSNAA